MKNAAIIEARKPRMRWTPDLHRVYQQYPASIRSKFWPEIVAAAARGDVAQAKAIAKAHEERHPRIRAENISARRLRIERLAAFGRLKKAQQDLQAIFQEVGSDIAAHVQGSDPTIKGLRKNKKMVHEGVVYLRRRINSWARTLIKDIIQIGLLNMGAALKPIFLDNKESFAGEIQETELMEARLSFGLSTDMHGNTDPEVDLESAKWQKVMDSIYERIATDGLDGMSLSERIWDITTTAEMTMNRILSSGVAQGTSSRDIAKQLEAFLTPEAYDAGSAAPGMYKSAFKNAMRMARTETNRAYTMASAEWAQGKDWIEGMRITLSPAHDVEDDCDDVAGDIVSPDDLAGILPVHPHCMCFGVTVIKDEFLAPGSTGDESPIGVGSQSSEEE